MLHLQKLGIAMVATTKVFFKGIGSATHMGGA